MTLARQARLRVDRAIVQARAFRNFGPSENAFLVIRQWAEREKLRLAP